MLEFFCQYVCSVSMSVLGFFAPEFLFLVIFFFILRLHFLSVFCVAHLF